MVEIHEMSGNVRLDVILRESPDAVGKLELLEQLVELVGAVGLEKLYPNEGVVFLSIGCTNDDEFWSVHAEDGRLVEAGSGGFSDLADRFDATADGREQFVIMPRFSTSFRTYA